MFKIYLDSELDNYKKGKIFFYIILTIQNV